MVVSDPEILSHGEAESPLQADPQARNHAFPSLGRQSSIYSLTLDEFQHTVCENGKNFGSMNMDEFLNSIWTAEENQAFITTTATTTTNNGSTSNNNNNGNANVQLSLSEASSDKGIAKQPSLPRQGSLTLPAPLCRKTVEEVWSEIHGSQRGGQQQTSNNVQNPDSAPRQPTFGEMTLEDFLIRAGVVREQCTATAPPQPLPAQQQQYGLYQNNNNHRPTFVSRAPLMGGVAGGGGGGATYQTLPHGGGGVGESSSAYAANGKRSSGYLSPPVCYGGRVGTGGGGGYGQAAALGMEATVSPVSSDGMCTNQVDNAGNQYGLDMGGLRGRKRIVDGPVEKVVERRQRRMIKNRESAARSRARKQAYTVELEAELNQLREENNHLKQTLTAAYTRQLEARLQELLEENARLLKNILCEAMEKKPETKAETAARKLQSMRRHFSCQF
ncbi:hypothetical protein L1049_008623 [Liquidambar formosana]|uniref:BZIP domain-containing protein n=1 Tax=Liquidambar formosana TaxID=63359 RepID=A0AAP0X8E0_LIQFO